MTWARLQTIQAARNSGPNWSAQVRIGRAQMVRYFGTIGFERRNLAADFSELYR